MQVIQVNTTNDKFSKYNNVQGELIQILASYVFVPTSSEGRGYTTSATKRAGIVNDQFVLETRNSTYTYEIT